MMGVTLTLSAGLAIFGVLHQHVYKECSGWRYRVIVLASSSYQSYIQRYVPRTTFLLEARHGVSDRHTSTEVAMDGRRTL